MASNSEIFVTTASKPILEEKTNPEYKKLSKEVDNTNLDKIKNIEKKSGIEIKNDGDLEKAKKFLNERFKDTMEKRNEINKKIVDHLNKTHKTKKEVTDIESDLIDKLTKICGNLENVKKIVDNVKKISDIESWKQAWKRVISNINDFPKNLDIIKAMLECKYSSEKSISTLAKDSLHGLADNGAVNGVTEIIKKYGYPTIDNPEIDIKRVAQTMEQDIEEVTSFSNFLEKDIKDNYDKHLIIQTENVGFGEKAVEEMKKDILEDNPIGELLDVSKMTYKTIEAKASANVTKNGEQLVSELFYDEPETKECIQMAKAIYT